MSNRALKPLIENAWYLAAWSNELSEKPLAREIVNKRMVLFRDADGNAAALEDRCVHRAAPLSCGRVVKEGLQCGYHGLVFDKNGKCTENPADNIGNLRVRSYRVEERQKFVWVWTGDQALADPKQIVDFPYHDDTTEWPFQFGYFNFKCSYMLVMDNLMDLTHLGYVHTKTIGGNPQAHDNAMQETSETPFGALSRIVVLPSVRNASIKPCPLNETPIPRAAEIVTREYSLLSFGMISTLLCPIAFASRSWCVSLKAAFNSGA